MGSEKTYDLIVIGGGLAGLSCALHLSTEGFKVLLIEKYSYPHHKVCGEYVSNEILPYLKNLGIDPFEAGAKAIAKFEISNTEGAHLQAELPLGGFGISRYALDEMLYLKVLEKADVIIDTVVSIDPKGKQLETQSGKKYRAEMLVGAFGKRSNLDKFLNRPFLNQRSPWLGVKAHYEFDFPEDTVALHNFEGGYCGLSQTETGAVNACYLTTYRSFRSYSNIPDFQNNMLTRNPYLKEFFSNARMLFPKPLSISQISFSQKKAVEQGICMIGDSAGLIHPLCGNGMAMAIHSAKIFSELFEAHFSKETFKVEVMNAAYESQWNDTFGSRLKTGRRIQSLLLNPTASQLGFRLAKWFPGLVPGIIKKTHGEVVL